MENIVSTKRVNLNDSHNNDNECRDNGKPLTAQK